MIANCSAYAVKNITLSESKIWWLLNFFVKCTDCMLLTRRIGMSCQWKKEEKTSFKSVIGEQKIGEVWKGVYESVAGERQLGEAFIFIKTDYRHLTQLLLMIPASDLCFYQVWCWKKTHFNTDSSAKIMLACNVHANVWVYYSVNPSLNRMSRGTPERKGESRITELHRGKST